MGNGDKQQQKSLQLHQGKRDVAVRGIPKGCLAVLVGQGLEPKQRFVVPVGYFSHPLFLQLLQVAEDEFGFEQKGNIIIPCHVADFQHLLGVIGRENAHHHHHISCFRA
ncbi:hypothetical protein ACLOJK_006276 [Asimina triloba]